MAGGVRKLIDVENAVYDAVAKAVREQFPGIFVTGDEIDTPPRFPCLSLREIDNTSYPKSQDYQKIDHHANISYEAQAFSNLETGRKAQAKAIMNAADAAMLKLGLVRIMNSPAPNMDRTIGRRVARWRGVVSEYYRVYTS